MGISRVSGGSAAGLHFRLNIWHGKCLHVSAWCDGRGVGVRGGMAPEAGVPAGPWAARAWAGGGCHEPR
jgi:hypothetical protein